MAGTAPHGGQKITCGAKTRTCVCGHHVKQHLGKTGACGTCGANAGGCQVFRARPCSQTQLGRGGRCRSHGGKSLAGIESPTYRTGRWSKDLPTKSLGEQFDAAFRDRHVMQLRQDVALIDALLTSYTKNLRDTGRPLTLAQQERVLGLLEQKRKHVESEARRLRDLAQVVPMDQYRNAIMQVSRLITQFVGENPVAMRELGGLCRRVLTGKGAQVTEGEVVDAVKEGGGDQ